MEDERATRCWIHPKLKDELANWHSMINDLAIKKTNYPIQEGMPLASKLVAKILFKVRKNLKKEDFNIFKAEGDSILNIELLLGAEAGDLKNLTFTLNKMRGVKKNEINFI